LLASLRTVGVTRARGTSDKNDGNGRRA